MAISRVPGYALLGNLDRQGTDLYFTTNSQTLVYMDFTGFTVGINEPNPYIYGQSLVVNGNLLVKSGHLLTTDDLQYDLGNITNRWRNIYIGNISSTTLSGTLLTNAQPNITSIGNLTYLTVTGNISAGNIIAPVFGNVTGTILTNTQPYITSLGNLIELNVNGNIFANTITSNLYGNVTGLILTNIQPYITTVGTLGNLNVTGNVLATNYIGTLLTNNQPNITTVGTLSNLSVSGNLTVNGNLIVNGVTVGNLSANTITANIIGNVTGYVLQGDQPFITNLGNITVSNITITGGNLVIGGNANFDRINASNIYQAGNQVLDTSSNIQIIGDVTGYGPYNNINVALPSSGVVAGAYGSQSQIAQFTVDDKGRLLTAANVTFNQLANITFNDTTISTAVAGANLILSTTGAGATQVAGSGAFGLPYGTSAQRPTTVDIGYTRFNTDLDEVEFWDGSSWITPGQVIITSDVINPDGTANTYTLGSNSTTTGVMVSINGTIQQPYTAYNIVSNNQIQFTEVPLTTDIIEVRHMALSASTISSMIVGNTSIVLDGVSNVNVTGNLVVSGGIFAAGGGSYLTSNPVYYTGQAQNINLNATLVDSILAAGNSLVRWTLTSTDNGSNFKSSTIDALNDGANVYFSEYAVIYSNANIKVSNFVSNISSGNIRLWAIGNTSNVTVTFQRIILGSTTLSGYQTAGPKGDPGATGPAGTISNTSGVILTTNTSVSNTITNGALIAYGGAGIGGNLNVGGPVSTFAGNIVPAANVTYSLGSPTLQWKDLYVSGNTIFIGGTTLSVDNGVLIVGQTAVGTSDYSNVNTAAYTESMGFRNYSNVNVKAYSETIGYTNYSNVNVKAYSETIGYTNYSNVNVKAYTESLGFKNYSDSNVQSYTESMGFANYSNVNVKAYTESMGFRNYSNVNVKAYTESMGFRNYSDSNVQSYTESMGFRNYSNVNVKAYTESMGFQNYGNVNVAAYSRTQSYTNYSNVNVKAYTESMSFANYSNVNVQSYTESMGFANYGNVNVEAYLGGAVTIGGNLTVNGNLFVNGNLTTINANNLNINDSMIYLADDNPADTLDIGFVSAFTSDVRYQHTGLVRDATDGVWKLFANVVSEPTTTIDFTNATYSNLQIGNLTAQIGTFTGNVSANSYVGSNINLTGNLLANTVSVYAIAGIITTASQRNITAVGTLGNLAVTGNVTAGNLSISGNITTTGSITQNGVTGGIIPIGGIIMWSGNIASIPTSWALCNGTNGTPDLRDRFIVGAAADSSGQANTTVTGSTSKTGGTANAIVVSHTHTATVTDPGHFHSYGGGTQVQAGADNSGPVPVGSTAYSTGSATTGISVSNSTEGSSGTNQNLPPYYALAFIMRIS